MLRIQIWKGLLKLTLKITDESFFSPDEIVKFVESNKVLYMLDSSNRVWQGVLCDNCEITMKQTSIKAIDIATTPTYLYYVSESGRVYCSDFNLEYFEEVILQEEETCCTHGYTTAGHRVLVKKISAGGLGIMFVSERGELWVSGDYPDLSILPEDQPKRVTYFEGRHITQFGSGDDFCIVLAHKRDDFCPTSNGHAETDGAEVFISSCPQCPNNIISPSSVLSDMCPLSLNLKKSTESLSVSTPTSKLNEETKKSDICNTSSSAESLLITDANEQTTIVDNSVAVLEPDEKNDKMTKRLINTEAARQFLTKQLSWMSTGGEELLAEVSVPTRIIKQNVTSMASLVYEGVKTVGDKVATLSRHMSGGSDNDSDSFEEFDVLCKSDGSLSSIKLDLSAASETSEDGCGVEKINGCISVGSRIIKGELWAWGNSRFGQLGNGDCIRRNKPISVSNLQNCGVIDLECGKFHSLAMTLDGGVLLWGDNSRCQVSCDLQISQFSSPTRHPARVRSASASNYHSALVTHDGSLIYLGPSNDLSNETGVILLNSGAVRTFCAGDYTICLTSEQTNSTVNTDLTHEQCFLEELITVQSLIVKPLARRSIIEIDESMTNLIYAYTDIVNFTAALVYNLLLNNTNQNWLTDSIEEHLQVYKRYLSAVCDVITSGCISTIVKNFDVPVKITNCFQDRLPSSRKTSAEAVVTYAFTQPLNHIAIYKGMVLRGNRIGLDKWDSLIITQESYRKEAELTRLFWENAGRSLEPLRTAKRRLIKESKTSPITLSNASRFSSHWFILFNDVFVHVTGSNHFIFNLDTLWVDSASENEGNGLFLIMPEETLTLTAAIQQEKIEWLHAFQSTIKNHLKKSNILAARTASYTFTKNTIYKDAKYTGRWVCGKLEGTGKMEWSDKKVYSGQFHNNFCHGLGRLEIPKQSIYEGQWKDGLQNGYGTTKYDNGDIYVGYYKDGLENGHGVRKTGRFLSKQASFYVGEWSAGQKQGYGIFNNVGTGEKYLGSWNGNMKNGSGLIITLEGVYYEGTFVQDVLTGHGIMIFDDGSHYEGELREAGIFSGKGILTFSSGDTFEGTLHGSWNEGVKVSGTLHKHLPTSPLKCVRPSSFGQLCVSPEQKWRGIFRACWSSMGVTGWGEKDSKSNDLVKIPDSQRLWESLAVSLSSKSTMIFSNSSLTTRQTEKLHTIPLFGRSKLTKNDYNQITNYLTQAFEIVEHPLGRALTDIMEAYTTAYGGILVHPLLLSHAVEELHSLTFRLYQVVKALFPALPDFDNFNNENNDDELKREVNISISGLLHPIILPKVYSTLLVLYSLHNRAENETYWKRVLKWNRHPDITLMPFLGIDKKFWLNEDGSIKKVNMFFNAAETLQQLKTTFSPMEKLFVIRKTFEEITKVVYELLNESYEWTMDDLFPIFQYVVVRSHIQDLGSEIQFIDDFMELDLKNGELGIMFTTLKACFYQILQEKISISV